MKDYYHILITRKNTDSEYKKYNICSLKEIEGYYKSYIIGEKILIDNNKIKHSDISNFTIMKSSKKVEDKNISFNSNDDDIKNCTEEIKQNIELNIFETLKKFYYENKWFTITIIALILLSILNIILPIYKENTARSNSGYEFFGIIGDSSGLLGTILSGLAFLLLIYTATLQKNELSLQRKELEATRTELENQKKEFQIQNQTLKRQQFENTFFNMLHRQENIISAIKFHSYEGRESFDIACSSLKYELVKFGNNLKEIQDTYKLNCLYSFGYYFCHLYRIIKFVHENEFLTDNEKSNYIDILRAGLSTFEIILLFYNGLTFEQTKFFIEKYKLLDPLIFDFLPIKKHIMLYDIKAYGNNEYLINLYNAFPIIKKILAKNLSNIDAKVYIVDSGPEQSCDLYFGLYLKDKKIDIDQIILVLDKEFKENLNSIKVNIFNSIEPKEDSVEFKYNNDSI